MAATISYTSKFAEVHNPINFIENELSYELEKNNELEESLVSAHDRYNQLLKELQYAALNIAIIDANIGNSQDKINELSVAKEDMLNETLDNFWDDVDDCAYDFVDYEHGDYECKPKERKVRSDVLTVGAAIASNKSSKNHKLKPKSGKKDRSKSPEAKAQSKKVKASHM